MIPVSGEDALPYRVFSIRPDKNDCLPAITAFLKAKDIKKGFLALAMAVFTRTPSHPSSIDITASDACPNPASTIIGSLV